MHQNAPNCTIYKNFLRGACPQTPPSKAHGFATCKFPNLKKKILGPPPLPNPGDAPDTCSIVMYTVRAVSEGGRGVYIEASPTIPTLESVKFKTSLYKLQRVNFGFWFWLYN